MERYQEGEEPSVYFKDTNNSKEEVCECGHSKKFHEFGEKEECFYPVKRIFCECKKFKLNHQVGLKEKAITINDNIKKEGCGKLYLDEFDDEYQCDKTGLCPKCSNEKMIKEQGGYTGSVWRKLR